MPEKNTVRVRFAPSPTGYLHLGSARTALFNWLYARHTKGKMVLRIEDTDTARSKKEYLDEILEDLRWMGIDWDEGPLFQSQRISIYKDYATRLLDKGVAYKEEGAIIFKVEKSKEIKVEDIVHGEIVFNTDEIKDQVLIKSNGLPAYNFACVVDDHDMAITHIVRGDDHVSNTPKQLLFYEALGFDLPKFAHMPLMMGKDGAKLSKRHGAVAVFEYKKEGFLPEALSNYLFLLGWSAGEDREIMTLGEAAELFDIKDLGNVQARFDTDKLRWINGEYIMKKSSKDLFILLKTSLKEAGYGKDALEENFVLKVIDLYKTRFKTLSEFIPLTECFFKDDYKTDEKAHKKYLSGSESRKHLGAFNNRLKTLKEFERETIENTCRNVAEELKIKPANLIHPTRVAISGQTAGAGLFEMMELLGKNRVIERLERFVKVS